MSSVVDSDTHGAAKPGPTSRAASKVTFREGEGKQAARSSSHPTEADQRSSSHNTSFAQQQTQLSGLKKKDEINPFKFSPDVDFCALSQLDKREKSQERDRMQNLKVHEKLSKAQRLMQGRRFRVLKEIDEEIDQEVKRAFVLTFLEPTNDFSEPKTRRIASPRCATTRRGSSPSLEIVEWKTKVCKILSRKNATCSFYK